MKFLDVAFGATLAAFSLGSLAGALVTSFSLTFREFMLLLINLRVVAPVRSASEVGKIALMLLIFINNCIPVALSFGYALIIGKVRWTPPMRAVVRKRLLAAFSVLTAGLLGFFNLGSTLTLLFEIRGLPTVNALVRTSWVHAPLEFLFVLLCVAEPMRLSLRRANMDEIVRFLRADTKLLIICLVGLLASAAIEAFAGL
jgi:hypothetical protein